MTQSSQDLADETADSVQERWNNRSFADEEFDVDEFLEHDVLDIRVESDFKLNARRFVLVTGVGGPRVEIDVTRAEITVAWGATATRPIVGSDDVLEAIEERLLMQWESATA